MQVIGQFNVGFIIAQLGQELFILDQHACDEKYRYEQLLALPAKSQALIAPMQVELSVNEEMVVETHMAHFQRNGFSLKYDGDAQPTLRVSVCAFPSHCGQVLNVNGKSHTHHKD